MRDTLRRLVVPPVLLVLISTSPWPAVAQYGSLIKRAPPENHWPEHDVLLRRDAQVQEMLATARPVGVRKMSEDEGEKFFLDYWGFDDPQLQDEAYAQDRPLETADFLKGTEKAQLRVPQYDAEGYANGSAISALFPPFLLHSEQSYRYEDSLHFFRRATLQKRAWQCPTGTAACSQIDRPYSCCAVGEVCVLVKDTGVGDVGCCPGGVTCGGQVSSCNTAQGYSNCPGSSNGGCCIPGFACQDIGCVTSTTITSTTTELFTLTLVETTQTVITTGSTSTTIIATTTIVTIRPTVVSPSSATSATPAVTSAPTTTTVLVVASTAPPSLVCSSGYQSCAASLGGQCCSTDSACGVSTCSPLSTAAPAVRPTSETQNIASSTVTNTVTTTAQTAATASVCPTGFYACSAVYLGGCCRVGRNCDSTNCPPGDSTTIVSGGPVIIVTSGGSAVTVASGATTTTTAGTGALSTTTTYIGTATTSSAAQGFAAITGNCANGWFNCDVSLGGGCCPSGFVCGTTVPSCTATVAGVGSGTVAKIAASAVSDAVRNGRGMAWGLTCLAVVFAVGMPWL